MFVGCTAFDFDFGNAGGTTMDDTVTVHALSAPPWEPERGFGGEVKINVNGLHPLTGRRTGLCLSPAEYIRRLDDGTLFPSVDHPTREQVAAFLASEAEKGGSFRQSRAPISERAAKILFAPATPQDVARIRRNAQGRERVAPAPLVADKAPEKEEEEETVLQAPLVVEAEPVEPAKPLAPAKPPTRKEKGPKRLKGLTFAPCQVRGGEEAPEHFCRKISGSVDTAPSCGKCKSPFRVCYTCLLDGRQVGVAHPPDGKGLCWECLGYPTEVAPKAPPEPPPLKVEAPAPPEVEAPSVEPDPPVTVEDHSVESDPPVVGEEPPPASAAEPEAKELLANEILADPLAGVAQEDLHPQVLKLLKDGKLAVRQVRKLAQYARQVQVGLARQLMSGEKKMRDL